MTIYDVLRALVDKGHWSTEHQIRRMHAAINQAEQSGLFGVAEGMMEL